MLDRTKVEEVINRIRPYLRRNGGDVELVVPPAGVEPAAPGLGNLCSILLS